MSIIKSLDACTRPFPLAIIGAEARTDEDRLPILQLMARTQAKFNMGSVHRAERFIKACWAQDDLNAGEDLDFATKLDWVITSSEALPTFA